MRYILESLFLLAIFPLGEVLPFNLGLKIEERERELRPIPVDTLAGFRVPELDEPVVGRRQEVIAGVVEITVLEFKVRIVSSENYKVVNLTPVTRRSRGSKIASSK